MNRPIAWLALLLGAAIGLTLGWVQGRAPLLTQLAQAQTSTAQAAASAAAHALQTLQAEQARGDALTTALVRNQSQINQRQKDAHAAIPQATTGRACLNSATLRVLNAAPGLHVANLPNAASGANAAGGTPAADTDHISTNHISTDTNISAWAIDAGAAYEACRARLDALIAWHTPHPATTGSVP